VRADGQRQRDDDAVRRNVQALRRLLLEDVQDVDGCIASVSGRERPFGLFAKRGA
jgi:hypothetical protein